MYESLLEWCRFPVNIHYHNGHTIAGDDTHAAPVSKNGYRVDEMRVIQDKTGNQYVSYTHVYFPQTVDVSEDDQISFPDNVAPRDIKKVSGFYDGTLGALSLRVIYL